MQLNLIYFTHGYTDDFYAPSSIQFPERVPAERVPIRAHPL